MRGRNVFTLERDSRGESQNYREGATRICLFPQRKRMRRSVSGGRVPRRSFGKYGIAGSSLPLSVSCLTAARRRKKTGTLVTGKAEEVNPYRSRRMRIGGRFQRDRGRRGPLRNRMPMFLSRHCERSAICLRRRSRRARRTTRGARDRPRPRPALRCFQRRIRDAEPWRFFESSCFLILLSVAARDDLSR